MAEDITMKVEVAGQALQTIDALIAAVDKLTAAEQRAAKAAEKVEKALNAAGGAGGSGRGGGGGGGGGGGSGKGGGGGGGSSSSRTIDEEVDHRLKRQKREDRVRAEMERRNPTTPKSFQQKVFEKVNDERDRAKMKDATDKQLGRGKYAPKAPPKPPKTFDEEVKERIAGETKRRALKEKLDAHFAAPPKTFDDEVKQGVAAHRKRAALDKAIQAKINPGGRAAGMLGSAAEGMAGGPMAMLAKLGPYAAAAAAALVAFEVGLKKSTSIVNIEHDGTQTRAQKDRGIVEELVPFAQSIRKFREAVDGTTESLAKNKRDLERSVFRIGAKTTMEQKSFNFRAEAEKAGTLLQAYSAPGATAQRGDFENFDRGSARGARAAAEQDITLPAYDERRRAGVEASAAREFANRMKGTADKASVDTKALKKDADAKAQRVLELRGAENAGGPRNKAGIDKAATEALKAQEEYLKAQQREEQLILRAKEAGLTATQAESNARKANINAQKAELEVLKQREERMTSAAQKVGSMSRAEREIAKAMAVQVEQHLAGGGDIADLPSDMVDQAKAFLPERISKAQEASGAKELGGFAKQNSGIDDSVLADFEKTTIAEVRAKVDQVKADVRISIDLDVQELAKSVVDTINPLFRNYIDSVFGEFKGLMQKFDTEREQKYNSEHP